MLKGLERMKLRCNGLRFTVKEEAKIVVCSGDFVCRQTGKNYHVHAVAKTDDVDAFDETVGKLGLENELVFNSFTAIKTWSLFNPAETELTAAYDRALAQLKEDGFITEKSIEYFGEDIIPYITEE